MTKLGVNIDHIATLRQARREFNPDPIAAALICEKSGADSIVAHLREDRRHIQDNDIIRLRQKIHIPLNMEMSTSRDIVKLALKIIPHTSTLVPEKRTELTTEGGLDVIKHSSKLSKIIHQLKKRKIIVSLFIDPVKKQIKQAKELGADAIELHTGKYDHLTAKESIQREFLRIKSSAQYAKSLDLFVAAGHGLKYQNTKKIVYIKEIQELNIGHSIICRAAFIGLANAVKEIKRLLK